MATITKAKKIELSKEMVKEITACDLIFVSFGNIGFEKIQNLRNKLKESKAKFKVVRNSVIYFALKEAGFLKDGEQKPDFLKGPTAVIFIKDPDEISAVSKAVVEFIKENPTLTIKGGFLSKEQITPDFVKELSKLGSKKEIVFKLVSSLYGCMLNMRNVIEAPLRDLVYVLDALKRIREETA